MPSLDKAAQRENIKLLLLGDSGSGKTGALACLAEAGYNLRILDFDVGAVDVLTAYVDPKYWPQIEVVTLTDKLRARGTTVIPVGQPKAFAHALGLLDNWRYWLTEDGSLSRKEIKGQAPEADFGPLSSWTSKDILVIDSFSHMGTAAFRYVLFANNRSGQQPFQSDWGEAQRMLEGVLQELSDSTLKCSIIVNTHVTIVEPTTTTKDGDQVPLAGGIIKGLPAALGKALSPRIGTYFNTTLLCKTRGVGNSAKRRIHCLPEGLVEVKLPAKEVPRDLPVSDGLKTVFDLLLPAE